MPFNFNQTEFNDYIEFMTRSLPDRLVSANRDLIYKQVVDYGVLRDAFDTEDGQKILRTIHEEIVNDVAEIVKLSADQDTDKDIRAAAMRINANLSIMRKWAMVFVNGNRHVEDITKIRKAKEL